MTRFRIGKSIVFLLLLFTLTVPSAQAQTPDDISLDIRVGFDGYVQQNTWVPITVVASNDGSEDIEGELRVVVNNQFATGETTYTRPISLPQSSRRTVTLYITNVSSFGTSNIQVDLLRRGRTILSERPAVQFTPAETLLIGIWSDTPQSLAAIGDVKPPSEVDVAVLDETDLPSLAKGWSALDILVISDTDTGQLSSAQLQAMEEWIISGGRVVIVGGLTFQRTVSGLESILPLRPDSSEEVSVEALVEAVAGGSFGQGVEEEAEVAIGDPHRDAEVLVVSDNIPLVLYREYGEGRVDFFAADPALEPLRSYQGMNNVWAFILADAEQQPGWSYGFNTTQWATARSAAADIPGVSLPSVLQLLLFLGCYAVLVGPVNYIVLRILKRREWAWLTVPALVLIFSVLAYVTGFRVRGSRPIVHRLAVVQMWQGQETAEVNALVGVWSPRRARYEMELPANMLGFPLPREFSNALATPTNISVEQGETVTLKDIRVDVGSIEPLAIEGFIEDGPQLEGQLEVVGEGTGIRIEGEVVNFSPVDLEDVRLIFAGTSTEIRDIPAGEVVDISAAFEGGNSSPATGTGLDPYPANTNSYYNTVVLDLIGQDNCFTNDEDIRARCNLVQSIVTGEVRDSDVYLVGWSDSVPFELGLNVNNVDFVDRTLYIFELDAQISGVASGSFSVPPGLMSWQFIENDSDAYNNYHTPYDLYISQNQQVVFRFEPFDLVPASNVDRLELTIAEYYETGEGAPVIELLNVNTGEYDRVDVDWGSTEISDAQRYIDAGNGVTVRVQAPRNATYDTSISQLDITYFVN